MKRELEEQSKWYLITIDDPEFLSGKSINNLLKFLLKQMEFKFVVFNNVDGSGKDWLISYMKKIENTILNVSEFFQILDDINQLDWCDFFLFIDYPNDWIKNEKKGYSQLIQKTDCTLRLIDNQYFYIYTNSDLIVSELKMNYKIESEKYDFLDCLDYPC